MLAHADAQRRGLRRNDHGARDRLRAQPRPGESRHRAPQSGTPRISPLIRMALKATIFKTTLHIADMDRAYYGEHALTIARHPSETDERMMVRVLAYALHASERLAFGRGLSDLEEPDVWEKDRTGAIETWIDVGLPDE